MCESPLGFTAAIVRASGLVTDICAAAAARHDLTIQQAQLLCVLAHRPSTMAQLSALIRITKSSTTGLIDRAAEAGLVVRDTDPQDRRTHRVSLSTRGAALGESYRATVTDDVADLFADASDTERDVLRATLSHVVVDNNARNTWPADEPAA